MIDFRYHVVSIVAVFLALALGLFLGSTTLQGRVFDDLKGRVHSETRTNDQLRSPSTVALLITVDPIATPMTSARNTAVRLTTW